MSARLAAIRAIQARAARADLTAAMASVASHRDQAARLHDYAATLTPDAPGSADWRQRVVAAAASLDPAIAQGDARVAERVLAVQAADIAARASAMLADKARAATERAAAARVARNSCWRPR